jgi:DNA-binding HxlR family transcriptional regulator
MTTPRVGKPVRGSRSGRPIMVALDLLGRRAALRVLWELRGDEPLTFRALQEAAATNPALLNTRLKELREAGLVEHDGGYRLSAEGRALLQAMQPMSVWAEAWGGTRRPAKRRAAKATKATKVNSATSRP